MLMNNMKINVFGLLLLIASRIGQVEASGVTGEVTYYTTECFPVYAGCTDKITFVVNTSGGDINWDETEALEQRTLGDTGYASYYLSGNEKREIQLSGEKLIFLEAYGLFFTKEDSIYRNAFSQPWQTNTGDIIYDIDNVLKGTWDISPVIEKYLPVKNEQNELIGYILRTISDPLTGFNDLYAPLYQTTSFFTTNGTTVKTVLSGENTLRFTGTKEILTQQLPSIVNLEDKSLLQAFLTTGTLAGSQLHTLEGEKILFFDLGTGTLVLMSGSSIFQGVFTGGIAGTPSYDSSTLKPTGIPLSSVVAYNEVRKNGNLLGYALKNQSNQRFYAAKRVVYTVSGGGSAWIVAQPVTNTSTGDNQEEKKEEKKPEQPQEKLPEQTEKVDSGEANIPNCSTQNSQFTSEQNDAYLWACQHNITTMRTIQEARLDQPLTRAELAKIMSVYAMKEYHLKPLITGAANYKDVNTDLGDLADYIQIAYQLQIMGINADGTPMQAFEPHKLVSRAEFATVLSRVIWGNKHNISGDDRYSAHLQALKKYRVITSDVPANWWELRGRALLMLHRNAQSSVEIKS
ncbi:MAG: S-layer homology domain-containing protein [candidate division SR1 bacterium]|nr:S-layer homology domain-containing protein [candidate division SR1 bacterium]